MEFLWQSQSSHNALALMSAIVALTALFKNWNIIEWDPLERAINHLIAYSKRRYNAWVYLFYGPAVIQAAFNQSNGQPFEIFAPDNRYVFVSSPEHIKEIDAAPDTVLSLQAASKQMLQPRYSMHGFSWFDRRGTEGVGFIRALRTLLTNHLPILLPDLRVVLSARMNDKIMKQKSSTGTSQVPIYPTIVNLVVLANSLSFFGKDLARNEEFMKAALSYIEETIFIAEIVRLLPRFLHPIVGSILARRVSSHATVYAALMAVAEERVYDRDHGINSKTHNDCIQWIMETSPKQNPWSAQRVVYELMAIWFGSVHAISTTVTFAIEDLCVHPEYVEPLRRELENGEYEIFEKTSRGLPLLDSFIKESARLTPVESLSTRRHALKPFTLSDGTRVEVGDWACTPVKALMQDGRHYPQPLEFSGFRFVDPKLLEDGETKVKKSMQPKPSKLTDVGSDFHVWGTGRMACPGRYYASAIMKILVAQVLLGYDIKLADQEARRWWTWRSSMLPMQSTLVEFSSRATSPIS